MKVIKSYSNFNFRRYSNPWVAIVDEKTAKPDFSIKVGGYTGGRDRGEAGDLYVTDPQEGAVYMYGQKDYRGGNTELGYVQYIRGSFINVSTTELLKALTYKANEEVIAPVEKTTTLTGSPKQVAWGEQIRTKKLVELKNITPVSAEDAAAKALVIDYLNGLTSAVWWIDHCNVSASGIIYDAIVDAKAAGRDLIAEAQAI